MFRLCLRDKHCLGEGLCQGQLKLRCWPTNCHPKWSVQSHYINMIPFEMMKPICPLSLCLSKEPHAFICFYITLLFVSSQRVFLPFTPRELRLSAAVNLNGTSRPLRSLESHPHTCSPVFFFCFLARLRGSVFSASLLGISQRHIDDSRSMSCSIVLKEFCHTALAYSTAVLLHTAIVHSALLVTCRTQLL